jgi:hypothetical protein
MPHISSLMPVVLGWRMVEWMDGWTGVLMDGWMGGRMGR